MHRSGITVGEELKKAFSEAGKIGNGFVKIQLADERFVAAEIGAPSNSLEAALDAARGVLEDRTPCYVLARVDNDKWILVMYVPDTAQVKDKMLYASSRSSLKEGLGGAHFVNDFFISKKEECTLATYQGSLRSDAVLDKSVLTLDEVIKREAQEDSMLAMSVGKVKVTAIADMPVGVSPSAEAAIRGFAEGKVVCASFYLDPTETLQGKVEPSASIDHLANVLKQQGKDPLYLLFSFSHEFENKQSSPSVFALYCNDAAPPRNKMIYSSCKSYVLKIFAEFGVTVDKKVQVNEPAEITSEFLIEELHPKTVAKAAFSKPKTPGKGKARMFDAPKFDPQG